MVSTSGENNVLVSRCSLMVSSSPVFFARVRSRKNAMSRCLSDEWADQMSASEMDLVRDDHSFASRTFSHHEGPPTAEYSDWNAGAIHVGEWTPFVTDVIGTAPASS